MFLGGIFRIVVLLQSDTLLGTYLYPFKGTFEDVFPFPKVGYVGSHGGKI